MALHASSIDRRDELIICGLLRKLMTTKLAFNPIADLVKKYYQLPLLIRYIKHPEHFVSEEEALLFTQKDFFSLNIKSLQDRLEFDKDDIEQLRHLITDDVKIILPHHSTSDIYKKNSFIFSIVYDLSVVLADHKLIDLDGDIKIAEDVLQILNICPFTKLDAVLKYCEASSPSDTKIDILELNDKKRKEISSLVKRRAEKYSWSAPQVAFVMIIARIASIKLLMQQQNIKNKSWRKKRDNKPRCAIL